MNYKFFSSVSFLSFIILLAFSVTIQAQNVINRQLKWNNPVFENIPGRGKLTFLNAEGISLNAENEYLPELYISEPAQVGVAKVKAEVISQTWEDLSPGEANFVGKDVVSSDLFVSTNITIERKKHFYTARIIPLKKEGSKFKKLSAISIRFVPISYLSKSSSNFTTYASNSVLGNGTFYQIATRRDGIYKITFDQLQQMGLNPALINPRNLKIYGNPAGMLPHANNISRKDDLVENAIQVVGEEDGRFDANDYVLFYGQSPHRWVKSPDMAACYGDFEHILHEFSDVHYYFVTVGDSPGKRISTKGSVSNPGRTVTTFNDFAYHEKDEINHLKSGRDWYGEAFDLNLFYDFPFSFPNLDPESQLYLKTRMAARSVQNTSTSFRASINGNTIQQSPMNSVSGAYTDIFARWDTTCSQSAYPGSDNFTVRITYSKGNNSEAKGWLDFVELNVRRKLIFSGNQLSFRDLKSVGAGFVSEFALQNGGNATIWDVTDPTNAAIQQTTNIGGTLRFTVGTEVLKEFIAFNGNEFLSVELDGAIANQNLHGAGVAEMLIVSAPEWLSQADRLADFHRNNAENPLTVQVVTPKQVYNEFSSGVTDVAAIRDLCRMHYEKGFQSGKPLKYLLLFGDGSYDNKNRLSNNTAFIPSYQSPESLSPVTSYVSDDFFALLDSNEGNFFLGVDVMDIGVGRLPVSSVEQATDAVNKIIGYASNPVQIDTDEINCCSGAGVTQSPDWRNIICFVADDEDGNVHMTQSGQLSSLVEDLYPWLNVDKIYFDAYQQVTTPGGQRYPDVNKAINERFEKGALLVNYTGHGGEIGLAHERVWMTEDILALRNINSLPAVVTATCEFSRWDDPSRTSAGEWVFLNPQGGGIALFTTTRLVYSAPNFNLNLAFLKAVFEPINGSLPAMGEVMRYSKSPNLTGGIIINSRNFSLLGDPAQRLAYPKNEVKAVKVNDVFVDVEPDTISALSLVTVSGKITDRNGLPLNEFNGVLYPTVYDKSAKVITNANDGGSKVEFKIQKNMLYKGKVSITNGSWQFKFVVPKDIAYSFGKGKMSFYAAGNQGDATGYTKEVIIGGSNPNATTDAIGPEVKLFMNDEKFVFGGITNENPMLLAFVNDSNGINTVGNGIGHDITAVLNQNTAGQIVLNDYYQADLNSYQSGKIRYNFSELPEGRHTLNLKVWDVYNNSSETYTEFVVAENSEVALKHVLNYPNPFSTQTSFMFEHNQTCNSLDVNIQIMTVSGKVVKTIYQNILTEGSRIDAGKIVWDGRDDYGDKIGRGVYIYRINVRNPEGGSSASQFERLVLLN